MTNTWPESYMTNFSTLIESDNLLRFNHKRIQKMNLLRVTTLELEVEIHSQQWGKNTPTLLVH